MNNELTMEDIKIIINNVVQMILEPFLEQQKKDIEAIKEAIQLMEQNTKDIEDAKQMISDLKLNQEN